MNIFVLIQGNDSQFQFNCVTFVSETGDSVYPGSHVFGRARGIKNRQFKSETSEMFFFSETVILLHHIVY